jgi:hypothetical protein
LLPGDVGDRDAHDLDELVQGGDLAAVHVVGLYDVVAGPGSRRGFNPAAAGGQVGQLRRQLSVRRGGMKVRELMTTYGDLITRVLPCVLVSPDSLARFFPASADLFDIVVFDEASQVRVADAIGAMGRARSVVVVGDSKQMPPTSFADSSFAGDDPEADAGGETVEDEESILTECVQARVERQRLTWHYRSQDESLIAFSNQHYYDGGLSSFPAPAAGRAGVSLVRVDGHFHRSGSRALLRTNPVEAEAVVTEIRRRFAMSPSALPSVGVVTFNQQQRAYVEGLLRDADDPRLAEALDDPDGLFVKNLENVQGDERDVIGLLDRVQCERPGGVATQLRSVEPDRRGTPAQRRRHPCPPSGDRVLELRSGPDAYRGHVLDRGEAPPSLPGDGGARAVRAAA